MSNYRHIKTRFKHPNGPSSDAYTVYGFESEWTLKTQLVGGVPVEAGQVVNFKPIDVDRRGRCVILGTPKNITKIQVLIGQGHMALAPGETLDSFEKTKVDEAESWPEPPKTAEEVREDAEDEKAETPVAKAVTRKRKRYGVIDKTAESEEA